MTSLPYNENGRAMHALPFQEGIKSKLYSEGTYKKNGGEREIRTLERLPVTRFPSVRLRPLGQLTIERAHHTIGVIRCQPCFHLTAGLIAAVGGRPIQYCETG
jgi:hypothetical protein